MHFYSADTKTAQISGLASGGENVGCGFLAVQGKVAIIGYLTSSGTARDVIAVHDGSYGDYTEHLVVRDSARFRAEAKFNSDAEFYYDGGIVGEITGYKVYSNTALIIRGLGNASYRNIVLEARDANNVSQSIIEAYATVIMGDGVYIQAGLSAQSVSQRSDERLKNVRAYEDAYDDVIDELEPITFTWKDGSDECEHVGLGARKTKDILNKHGLTDAGFSRDIGGTYVMNYNELTVMLLKRVQDLTKRVEELEALLCK